MGKSCFLKNSQLENIVVCLDYPIGEQIEKNVPIKRNCLCGALPFENGEVSLFRTKAILDNIIFCARDTKSGKLVC